MIEKKLEAVKQRSGMNIKSGRVMMQVKDRDWLLSVIERCIEADKDGILFRMHEQDKQNRD